MNWSLDFTQTVYFGNPVQRWAEGLLVAIACYAVLLVLRWGVSRRLAALAQRTVTQIDDMLVLMLSRTKAVFLLVLALRAGASLLALPAGLARGFELATMLVTVFQGGVWADTAVRFWSNRLLAGAKDNDPSHVALMSITGVVVRIMVWALAVLLAMQNMGIQVTALVAGLGVGGIAIALAVQNVLGDVFASLSIALDRPFVAGDFIVVDDLKGTVDHVGLKTTRVRSLDGEMLVFSNGDLLRSRIRNFGEMKERRVLFTLGITYETPKDKLARVPALLREVVEALPDTRFDRAHFKSYGDFALNFEVVYFVEAPDYTRYMDLQQQINLAVFEKFAAEGLEFAYPTQTVVVRNPRLPTAG